MKKNKIMRFASLLLVLTLLSTCAISGTFAKYTTTDFAKDEARVAKWGVTVTGTTEATYNDLFVNTYDNAASATVSATEAVVAPGTGGDFTNFDISGTPEVSIAVSYSATVDLGDAWVLADNTFYCPLIVTIGTTSIDGLDYTEVDKFEEAIATAISGCAKNYGPNKDTSEIESDMDITWSWPFAGTDTRMKQTDINDTYLGNLTDAPTISISVTATIDQVD